MSLFPFYGLELFKARNEYKRRIEIDELESVCSECAILWVMFEPIFINGGSLVDHQCLLSTVEVYSGIMGTLAFHHESSEIKGTLTTLLLISMVILLDNKIAFISFGYLSVFCGIIPLILVPLPLSPLILSHACSSIPL